jgi:hypothetical protein
MKPRVGLKPIKRKPGFIETGTFSVKCEITREQIEALKACWESNIIEQLETIIL